LRHVIVVGEGFSRLGIILKGHPLLLLDIFLATRGGLRTDIAFALLGGYFVFLDVGPSILFLVFPLFWVLWFIYDFLMKQ
jgi:hypothetical protein